MTPVNIVQFANGKYAVRRTDSYGIHEYLDSGNRCYWWSIQDHVYKYCLVRTLKDARKLRDSVLGREVVIE